MQPLQNRIQRLVGIVHLKFLESSVRCMHTRECGSHFSGRNDAIFGKTVIRKYREQGAEQAWIALVAVSVLEGQEAFAKAPQMPQRLNAHVEEAIVGPDLVFEAAMLRGRRVLRVELDLSAERRSGGGRAHVWCQSETQMEGTRERIFGHNGRPGMGRFSKNGSRVRRLTHFIAPCQKHQELSNRSQSFQNSPCQHPHAKNIRWWPRVMCGRPPSTVTKINQLDLSKPSYFF
jgi:hypothetical protein